MNSSIGSSLWRRSVADIVLRLRDARHRRGLSQHEAAKLSGVGEKTISSFETGERIHSMKISQLRPLLNAYGMTESEFFDPDFYVRPEFETANARRAHALVADLEGLDELRQEKVLRALQQMVEAARQSMRRGRRLA
jgi:transcriptional regulator with XRE-family HTH domain